MLFQVRILRVSWFSKRQEFSKVMLVLECMQVIIHFSKMLPIGSKNAGLLRNVVSFENKQQKKPKKSIV
jgi:hypothetical protein